MPDQTQLEKALERPDYTGKCVFVGSESPGITNVVCRLAGESLPVSYMTTIGVDFKTIKVEHQHKKIKLQMWDTPSQERFQFVSQSYLRTATLILPVIDCTRPLSEQEELKTLNETIDRHGQALAPRIVIMNKIDAKNRRVFEADEEEIKKIFGKDVQIFWVSAENGTGIKELREAMAANIYAKMKFALPIQGEEEEEINIQDDFKAIQEEYKTAQSEADAVTEAGFRTAYNLTVASRAEFKRLLNDKNEIQAIQRDLDQGKMSKAQARQIIMQLKILAPKVAKGNVNAEDLKPFSDAVAPVLSKHTKRGRWLAGLGSAALGCCIGGMLGMLCGPAAPFTVPAFMAVGTIVGAVLGGVSLGVAGAFLEDYWSMRRNPHPFYKMKVAVEKVKDAPKNAITPKNRTPQSGSTDK